VQLQGAAVRFGDRRDYRQAEPGDWLLAFALCVIRGFAFLWLFICIAR